MTRKIYENPMIGDKVVFLKTSRESGGECTLMELEVVAGGGNTLHTHTTASETFTVLEGNLEVQAGKERRLLKPGESFTVPPKTAHCFRNPSQQLIKFQVEFRPGHEGFENSLKIAYGLATDGLTNKKSIPKSFSHLALLSTMSDTYPTGIFSLITPLLRWKARQAREQGIEKELMDKYCR
ncbi:MAG: cupin domain-containing protein [Bacteroidota bacterium]|nr:cupin domain-containing protein [Bacteroidota bacterium]